MNRILTILTLFLSINISGKAQQGNNWYFGDHAGLSFDSSPPSALTNGQLNTREGCASISDRNGNILFYTDGITVFDKTHNIMPNGTGLMGHISSCNSAIIVPKPGSPHIYYIFTADAVENQYQNGYRFSQVDMRLHNGLGDITAQKNVLLYAPSTEKLTAVKHANGKDYWVITKGLNNNSFSAYQVGCSGVNTTPVVSNTGFVFTGILSGLGCIKVSPDAKKLGITSSGDDPRAELFDFDNATGLISNPIELTGFNPPNIYGVEFSPNSRLLYISAVYIYINQYDISSNNEAVINASRYIMMTDGNDFNATLQLGPDQKIYAATGYHTYLNVINNPDVYGPGCNLSFAAVDLNGRKVIYGLPAYRNNFYDNTNYADFTSAFIDCKVQFTGTTGLTNPLQWFWDFGDGNNGTGQIVTHSYSQVGTYIVRLKAVGVGTCPATDTFYASHVLTINNVFAVDFNNTGNCLGDNYSFNDNTVLTVGSITGYSWDFGDGSPPQQTQNTTHIYTAPGVYDVKLVVSTSGICRADSIIKKVFVDTRPTASFAPVNSCINIPISFTDASTNTVGGVSVWSWSFGDAVSSTLQNPTHAYLLPGSYMASLTVQSLHGCVSVEVAKPLTIFDIPVADYNIAYPCVDQGTVFIDVSQSNNGNITGWQWEFGDGVFSTLQHPTHIYRTEGNYTASLTVQSQYGCFSNPKLIPLTITKAIAFAGRDTIATYDMPIQLQATGGDSYMWTPATGLNNPFIGNPVAILRDDITYTVKVTDMNGCFSDDDVFIKVYSNNDVLVPGSFTPNGDGLNDIIKPLGFGLKKIEYFMIYNRYGELVFETHELDKGWNGIAKGKPQPMGTYTYRVKAVNYKNKPVEHVGTIILLR